MKVSRPDARALVHSSVMTSANQARLASFRNNPDLFEGVRWLSVLDLHSCLACAALDGASWDLEGEPIDGTKFDFCVPPLHASCRCILSGLPRRDALEESFPGISEKLDAIGDRPSSLGPLKASEASEYLSFLISVREIVEDSTQSISGRMVGIEKICARPDFVRFVEAERGPQRICDQFFPPVLSVISGLPSGSRDCLRDMHLNSVAKLNAASDATLLAAKGVGPYKLASIRAFCADFEGDVLAERTVDIRLSNRSLLDATLEIHPPG